jgi:hypothetical protein
MGISQSAQSMGFILATIFGGIVAAVGLGSVYYITAIFLFFSFILRPFNREVRQIDKN